MLWYAVNADGVPLTGAGDAVIVSDALLHTDGATFKSSVVAASDVSLSAAAVVSVRLLLLINVINNPFVAASAVHIVIDSAVDAAAFISSVHFFFLFTSSFVAVTSASVVFLVFC